MTDRLAPSAFSAGPAPAGAGARGRIPPYSWALLAVAAATAARVLLDPILDARTQLPYAFYFIAVLILGRYAGRGPALLALLLGTVCGTYFLTEPDGSFALNAPEATRLVSFVVSGLIAILIANSFRRAWLQATSAAAEARAKRDELAREVATRWKTEDSLTRYRLLAENARDVILFIQAADGRIVEANAAAESVYGYTRDELLARTIYDLRDPRTHAEVPAQLAEASVVGARFETIHRRADGTTFPVEVGSHGVTVGDEQVLLSVIRDITDRKRADQARAALAAIVEHSDDAIIGTTLDGTITSWNRAAERLYGYTSAEVVGRNILLLVPPDRQVEEPFILGRIRRDESVNHYESKRQAKDGRLIDVALTVSPVRDETGRVVGVSKIARDVSDRKRAEAALHGQNSRLRLLSNTVRHLLTGDRPRDFIPDLFRELAAALDLEVYFNYRVTEDGSRMRLDSYGGIPDDAARAIERLDFGQAVCGCVALARERRVVEDVQASDDPLTALIRSLGLTAYACHPLMAGGRLLGTLSFGTRTRSRFSDDDLAVMQAVCDQVGLAVERAELLDQSRRQADQLADADRRKDEFLAMLAHELRNPLAPVRNAVHLLRLRGPADPASQAARDMIDRQVGHLTRLVDDLLDVSRITRGKITLQRTRVDLRDLLRRAAELVRPQMEAKRHRFDLELPDRPVPVEGDETRLAQVVDNLLTNAAKYTDPGGQVRLALAADDGIAEVRVVDTGAGIPPDVLPRMFDLFTQAERTLDRAQGGLGIGLALVKRLVEMHGGSVEARSEGPGKGSEFTVRLPLANGAVGFTEALLNMSPMENGHSTVTGLRVLVVDDNADAAESLATLLGMLGHETKVAYDGPTGLEAAASFRPRVAILDIGLPGLSGHEMARRLRAAPDAPSLLVAMSGYGRDEDRRLSREAGFDHHLTKPVELGVLQAVLAGAVPRYVVCHAKES